MISHYKKYIFKKYFSSFFKVCLVFISIILIMNFIEEINFFKNHEDVFFLPFFLTLLNLPNVLFEISPFVFLISTIYFFIELIDKNEINVFKLYGLTNLKLIQILSIITFLFGILILSFFYNLSANLKFAYFETKNQHSKDDKYLAVITSNGLWIRDSIKNQINFINADRIEDKYLINITISEFDNNFNLKKILSAEKAYIEKKTWVLDKVIINSNNNIKKIEDLTYETNFNLERILSIFENLSSLNLLELETLKKEYQLLGYGTNVIDAYKHRLYSYPFYITLMIIIGAILMLNIKHNKSKITNIIIGILISVVIYYLNYFFNTVVETQDVPYVISIWGTQMILAIIVVINLIKLNEK